MDESKNVSLLVPCYKAAEWLPRLFSQLRAQAQPFTEIICYDDASPDRTAEVAESLGARVLRGTRTRGVGHARNRLLEAARCAWVHYHDADDTLEPAFVEKMTGRLSGPGEASICALRNTWEDQSRPDFIEELPGVETTGDTVRFFIDRFAHLNSVVFPTASLRQIGGFCNYLRFGEDRDVMVRVALTGIRFHYVGEILATWIHHRRSITNVHSYVQMARFNRWYLHRIYRRTGREQHQNIGRHALYLAWNFYLRGARQEARRYIYLAQLCGVDSPADSKRSEMLLAKAFGPEFVFFVKKIWADIRSPKDARWKVEPQLVDQLR